ncbi:vacuolar protein sorting-associated, VPS28, partial [Kipferlia bialata]|eukprot:g13931.t1
MQWDEFAKLFSILRQLQALEVMYTSLPKNEYYQRCKTLLDHFEHTYSGLASSVKNVAQFAKDFYLDVPNAISRI